MLQARLFQLDPNIITPDRPAVPVRYTNVGNLSLFRIPKDVIGKRCEIDENIPTDNNNTFQLEQPTANTRDIILDTPDTSTPFEENSGLEKDINAAPEVLKEQEKQLEEITTTTTSQYEYDNNNNSTILEEEPSSCSLIETTITTTTTSIKDTKQPIIEEYRIPHVDYIPIASDTEPEEPELHYDDDFIFPVVDETEPESTEEEDNEDDDKEKKNVVVARDLGIDFSNMTLVDTEEEKQESYKQPQQQQPQLIQSFIQSFPIQNKEEQGEFLFVSDDISHDFLASVQTLLATNGNNDANSINMTIDNTEPNKIKKIKKKKKEKKTKKVLIIASESESEDNNENDIDNENDNDNDDNDDNNENDIDNENDNDNDDNDDNNENDNDNDDNDDSENSTIINNNNNNNNDSRMPFNPYINPSNQESEEEQDNEGPRTRDLVFDFDGENSGDNEITLTARPVQTRDLKLDFDNIEENENYDDEDDDDDTELNHHNIMVNKKNSPNYGLISVIDAAAEVAVELDGMDEQLLALELQAQELREEFATDLLKVENLRKEHARRYAVDCEVEMEEKIDREKERSKEAQALLDQMDDILNKKNVNIVNNKDDSINEDDDDKDEEKRKNSNSKTGKKKIKSKMKDITKKKKKPASARKDKKTLETKLNKKLTQAQALMDAFLEQMKNENGNDNVISIDMKLDESQSNLRYN